MRIFLTALCLCIAWASLLPAQDGRVATITTDQLEGYETYTPAVKDLVNRSLTLTQMNLRYTYGSADPTKGGMDCSGTIHHLLLSAGIKNVPRQANTFYIWVWKNSRFHSVVSPNESSFEFQELKPGDLLFWSGTYSVDRDPPVTHVMMYLGKQKSDGKRVMFGASSGRRYAGKSRDGVSVFDFVLPKAGGEGRFLGYASIPGLEKEPQKIPIPVMSDPTPAEKPGGPMGQSAVEVPLVIQSVEKVEEEVAPPRAIPLEPSPPSP